MKIEGHLKDTVEELLEVSLKKIILALMPELY